MGASEPGAGERIRAAIGVFVTLAGVSASLTILFLGMRSVMDIGGACASGGPFVPRVECPQGVGILMVGSIWFGIGFAAAYVWQTFRHGAPSLAPLLWPALFLSLGANFLQYGLDPPFALPGVEIGWLVCAVVFGLMGGLPLLWAIPAVWRSFHGRGTAARVREMVWPRAAAPPAPSTPRGAGGWFGSGAGSPTTPSDAGSPTAGVATGLAAEAPTWVQPSPSASPAVTSTGDAGAMADDVVSALERLDALHRLGALDDAQYEEAKSRVLGDGR